MHTLMMEDKEKTQRARNMGQAEDARCALHKIRVGVQCGDKTLELWLILNASAARWKLNEATENSKVQREIQMRRSLKPA